MKRNKPTRYEKQLRDSSNPHDIKQEKIRIRQRLSVLLLADQSGCQLASLWRQAIARRRASEGPMLTRFLAARGDAEDSVFTIVTVMILRVQHNVLQR